MLKLFFALLIMLVVAGCKADQETFNEIDTLESNTEESLPQEQETNNDKLDAEDSQDDVTTATVETSPPPEGVVGCKADQETFNETDALASNTEESLPQEQETNNDKLDAEDSQDDVTTATVETSPPPEGEGALYYEHNNTKTSDSNTSIVIMETDPTLEPYYYQQWYLEENKTFYDHHTIDTNASIHTGEVMKYYSGKDVRIAIIDDGLDVTHEELNNSIIQTYDITTRTTNVSHNSSYGYHGTAVTGIIAANANAKGIIGIAHNAKIIFLKYKEGMSDSETIELFNKAEAFGADIINCSWGTYDVSQSVKEMIQHLANHGRDGRGTLIVFAVGNDAQDMRNDESAIPEVVAVGSTDKDNLRAWYSNFGENLDVMAPGGYELGITTLDDMGDNGISSEDENYLLYNDDNSFIGTSASAPIVTGAIALMLEANPELTRLEVMKSLKESSDKIGSVRYEGGRNDYYGFGKINLTKVLEYILK